MFVRKSALLPVLLVAICVFAEPADAQECGMLSACEPDYYGWDTSGGGFEPQPPTTTVCVAYGQRNQRCRACVEATWPDGTSKGYQDCGYVTQAGGCNCINTGTPSCRPEGTCTYRS
jgi:hypothetical protein